ncbi:ComEC/Rec2 family competence protein [Xylanimonas oleitrophica]|uniref:ComEC/Rec2 family competence protein n=1 Tax=Xylanimonas oleitrophica TaxID=2607479 RepID=A0A2W5WPZ3_9MICO|nr:ComEC/Rec2 family competence protein [Xylanimonas oleitrophica]PZR53649.1 ComEC/Rec2 family competence protein [Xylanimonas oleitrophica]
MSTDLRLAPAALAAWATAWTLTGSVAHVRGVVLLGAGAVLVLAVIALAAARSGRRPALSGALGQSVLVLGCVVVVALAAHVHAAGRAPVEQLAADRAVTVLSGRVASEPRPAVFGDGARWVLAADSVTARAATSPVRARVEVTGQHTPPYGARVVVAVGLAPAEPGDAVAARGTGRGEVEVVRDAPGLVAATTTMRTALLDVTDSLSPQARGLVPGVAVGDTSRLPSGLSEDFRTTGLTHLTAVSGGHFAVVLALVTAAAGAVRLPRTARVALVAAVAVGFVLLVRPEPSVQRAATMCAVTLLGIVLGRPAASVPALATCVVLLLTGDPWMSRSYGFALSCAATAGLVLLSPPLVRRLAPWLGRPAAFALAVPVAAQAACGPVLVLLAPAVPTTSVLANLLVTPAVAPATLLGLGATLTAPVLPELAHALAWAAGGATWWIAAVARWCAGLPGALLPWPGGVPGALVMLVATAAVLVLVLRRPPGQGWPVAWVEGGRRRWRAAGAYRRAALARYRAGLATRRDRHVAGAAAAVVVLVVAGAGAGVALRGAGGPAGGVPADWQVVACDVGQGDALVVRTGPASAVVVDVGPDGDDAGRCLDRLGVARVDLLVLSHFHADHVGGLPAALHGRDVRAALVSPLAQPAGQARRALDTLARAQVPVRAPEPGERGTLADGGHEVLWHVLGPSTSGAAAGRRSAEGDGANDASLSVRLRSTSPGGVLDVVTLGDLEEPGQEALLAALRGGIDPEVADGVDVVKMAHHGSAAQSRGLARLLRPAVVLVSVGAGNSYGHPTDRALGLYADVGATAVRTDECGTAVLVVRGGAPALACT